MLATYFVLSSKGLSVDSTIEALITYLAPALRLYPREMRGARDEKCSRRYGLKLGGGCILAMAGKEPGSQGGELSATKNVGGGADREIDWGFCPRFKRIVEEETLCRRERVTGLGRKP